MENNWPLSTETTEDLQHLVSPRRIALRPDESIPMLDLVEMMDVFHSLGYVQESPLENFTLLKITDPSSVLARLIF